MSTNRSKINTANSATTHYIQTNKQVKFVQNTNPWKNMTVRRGKYEERLAQQLLISSIIRQSRKWISLSSSPSFQELNLQFMQMRKKHWEWENGQNRFFLLWYDCNHNHCNAVEDQHTILNLSYQYIKLCTSNCFRFFK